MLETLAVPDSTLPATGGKHVTAVAEARRAPGAVFLPEGQHARLHRRRQQFRDLHAEFQRARLRRLRHLARQR